MTDATVHIGTININAIIRDLMDVARVAISPKVEQIPEENARAALAVLLELVDKAIPSELQRQDRRVQMARATLQLLRT